MTSFSALQALALYRPALSAAIVSLRSRLVQAGTALWRALEAQGQARAARELRALSEIHEHRDPELARQLRAASHFKAGS